MLSWSIDSSHSSLRGLSSNGTIIFKQQHWQSIHSRVRDSHAVQCRFYSGGSPRFHQKSAHYGWQSRISPLGMPKWRRCSLRNIAKDLVSWGVFTTTLFGLPKKSTAGWWSATIDASNLTSSRKEIAYGWEAASTELKERSCCTVGMDQEPLRGSANGEPLKWRMFMGERRCATLMTSSLILTDRSGGPLSRSGRGAVLVNYGLYDDNIVCI